MATEADQRMAAEEKMRKDVRAGIGLWNIRERGRVLREIGWSNEDEAAFQQEFPGSAKLEFMHPPGPPQYQGSLINLVPTKPDSRQ